jgi:hypothetical protein
VPEAHSDSATPALPGGANLRLLRGGAALVAFGTIALIAFNFITLGVGVIGIVWLALGLAALIVASYWLARGRVRPWIAIAVALAAVVMLILLVLRLEPKEPHEWARLAWLGLVLVVTLGAAIAWRLPGGAPPKRPLAQVMAEGEGETVEYKSSLRWDVREQRVNRGLQQVVAKTVAGFLNARGGILLIGVDDDGQPLGIEPDMQSLQRKDTDGFEQILRQVLVESLGADLAAMVETEYEQFDGKTIAVVRVPAAPRPAFIRDKRGSEFVVRIGNATRPLDPAAAHEYTQSHWRGLR